MCMFAKQVNTDQAVMHTHNCTCKAVEANHCHMASVHDRHLIAPAVPRMTQSRKARKSQEVMTWLLHPNVSAVSFAVTT